MPVRRRTVSLAPVVTAAGARLAYRGRRVLLAQKGSDMQTRWSASILGDREDSRERLAALFGGDVPASGQPPEPATTWALRLLRSADGQAVSTQAGAIRLLRGAEPRLTLKAATFLATHAMRQR